MNADTIEAMKTFRALDLVEQIELQKENWRLRQENAALKAALAASQQQGAK